MEKTTKNLPVPRITRCANGALYSEIYCQNQIAHQLRLLSYIPGVSVGNDTPYSHKTLEDVGRFQGQICKALAGFEHSASTHFMPWNSANGLAFNKNLHATFTPHEQIKLCELTSPLSHSLLPSIKKLRHQVIHNDGHAWNILFESDTNRIITGIIDFGDMVYAPLVNDLAVTAESFIRSSDDIIGAIGAVTKGFNEVMPLMIDEIARLHDLIKLRAILTILLEGYICQISNPPNQDLIDGQPTNWDFVERLNEIDPIHAFNHYKSVCKL